MNRTLIQILRELATGPKTFWQLISKQDSSIREFVEQLKNLVGQGLVEREKNLFKLTTDNLPVKICKIGDFRCRICGDGIDPARADKLKKKFVEAARERPLPREDFDQGFMRKEDTLKRAFFMYERGDVEEKNIFILGDDDLLSLALGLMEVAKLITVVEVDSRIINFIKRRAKELDISSIQVIKYNALDALPSDLCGNYHTFVTDPVETHSGLKIFLGRCIQSLKGSGCSGYFGLTHLEASLKKWYEIEKFLLDCNFVITDILRDFSFYPEADNRWERFYSTYRVLKEVPGIGLPRVNWYRSSFLRVEATDKINLPPLPSLNSFKELYFDEETWATPALDS